MAITNTLLHRKLALYPVDGAVAPSLCLGHHMVSGGTTSPVTMKQTLDVAQQALDDCQNGFYEIQACVGDTEDSLTALEHAHTNAASTWLSTLAVSGRELARYNVAAVGGVVLPDLVEDCVTTLMLSYFF